MIKKESISKLVKNASDLKNQAAKIGQDAIRTTGVVKQAIQTAIPVGKVAFDKAKKAVSPDNLSQGMKATSKGVEIAAKGARLASKSTGKLATTLETVSKGIKTLGGKLKK